MKTITRIASVVGLTLALSACSPQYWIETVFTSDAPAATRVATCESKMDPAAVSATNDHGLFQINAVHSPDFTKVTGQPWSAVYDAQWNTKYAKWLFDKQGWNPWSCKP